MCALQNRIIDNNNNNYLHFLNMISSLNVIKIDIVADESITQILPCFCLFIIRNYILIHFYIIALLLITISKYNCMLVT